MEASRPDLSPHIVHLTRRFRGTEPRQNLLSILDSECIEARTAYGIAVRHLEQIGCGAAAFKEGQKAACFSETPLEYLEHLMDPGVWRRYRFQAYGIAFSRSYVLDKGGNHVWYLNSFVGNGFRWRAHDVNALIDEVALDANGEPDAAAFTASNIARLTPLIEVMGEWTTVYGNIKHKDFTFEREWRFVGDFRFRRRSVAAVIVPSGETESFRQEMRDEGLPTAWIERVEIRELQHDED